MVVHLWSPSLVHCVLCIFFTPPVYCIPVWDQRCMCTTTILFLFFTRRVHSAVLHAPPYVTPEVLQTVPLSCATHRCMSNPLRRSLALRYTSGLIRFFTRGVCILVKRRGMWCGGRNKARMHRRCKKRRRELDSSSMRAHASLQCNQSSGRSVTRRGSVL